MASAANGLSLWLPKIEYIPGEILQGKLKGTFTEPITAKSVRLQVCMCMSVCMPRSNIVQTFLCQDSHIFLLYIHTNSLKGKPPSRGRLVQSAPNMHKHSDPATRKNPYSRPSFSPSKAKDKEATTTRTQTHLHSSLDMPMNGQFTSKYLSNYLPPIPLPLPPPLIALLLRKHTQSHQHIQYCPLRLSMRRALRSPTR